MRTVCSSGRISGEGGTWSRGSVPGPGVVPGLEGGLLWGVYLVLGGVPGPGGCTWSGVVCSRGVYLVPGGVYLVPGGVYLVLGGLLQEGCTWPGRGVPGLGGVYLAWEGCTWPGRGVPGLGGAPSPGGSAPGGVSAPRGVYLVRYSPLWADRRL